MLINLSNHVFDNWDQSQKKGAIKQFEAVVDFPFPKVDPNASIAEIEKLADDIVDEISIKYDLPYSIHVMGEFTLCYQLVTRFLKLNIKCYASTTIREEKVNTGEEKYTVFRFVQFRPYYKQ